MKNPGIAESSVVDTAETKVKKDASSPKSLWEKLPQELKDIVFEYASPMTLFLNGRFVSSAVNRNTIHRLWLEILESNWDGDLSTLPKHQGEVPLTNADLVLVSSRRMYDNLCRLLPDATESDATVSEHEKNIEKCFSGVYEDHPDALVRSDVYADAIESKKLRLLHVPLRHMWLEDLHEHIQTTPYAIAILCLVEGHARMLRHLADVRAIDLAQFGIQQPRVYRAVTSSSNVNAVEIVVKRGHLGVLKILYEAGACEISISVMNNAASYGYLDMLQWLHDTTSHRCTHAAMVGAAANGHLHVVKWLNTHQPETYSKWTMVHAVCGGHLDIVKYLHSARSDTYSHILMDAAASTGHLHLLKYLHYNRKEGCSKIAMDSAAQHGYYDIVKFLHENRFEGCTEDAINGAASAGHIDIVKFLLKNRSEGFSDNAVMNAKTDEIAQILIDKLSLERKQGILSRIQHRDDASSLIELLQKSISEHV